MRPEQAFWQWIKQIIPGHVFRIESSTGSGVPDVGAVHRGIHVWIELKIVQPDGCIYVRKEQHAWAMRHNASGGRVFLIADYPKMNELLIWRWPVQMSPIGANGKYVTPTLSPERRELKSLRLNTLETILFSA